MAEERFILTKAGYRELQEELRRLEAKRQDELSQYPALQPFDVDPSHEEGAYDNAREDKETTDSRIGHLKLVLEHADVIGDEDPNVGRVDPGERVTVYDMAERTTRQFDLIGSEEAIAGRRGVTVDSPVGKALLGRRVGDVITVDVPDGKVHYAIRKIERLPAEGGAASV